MSDTRFPDRASESPRTDFSLGDLIVGILASEVGALVWSLDADFGRMEKLELVPLYGLRRGPITTTPQDHDFVAE